MPHQELMDGSVGELGARKSEPKNQRALISELKTRLKGEKNSQAHQAVKEPEKDELTQIQALLSKYYVSWSKLRVLVSSAKVTTLKALVQDGKCVDKILKSGYISEDRNAVLDLLVDQVSDRELLIRFIEKRFGFKVGTQGNQQSISFLFGETEADFGPQGLKRIYHIMRRLPPGHVKRLFAITSTSNTESPNGYAVAEMRRININYNESAVGDVETGAYTHDGDKMRGINMLDTTVTHELAHVLDKGGKYSGQSAFRKLSGWEEYSVSKPANTAKAAMKYVDAALPSSFSSVEKNISEHSAKHAIKNRISDVEDTKDYVELAYEDLKLNKDGATAEGAYMGLRELSANLKVSPLFVHLVRANAANQPWYSESFPNLGTKQIHEAYEGRGWWAYNNSARSGKLSIYQFRDPGEEFAELYASYHMTAKKGEKIDEKRKSWFESQKLHLKSK